jgi:hypothetical protein
MDAVLEISRIIVPPLITVGLGAYVAQRFFVSRANEGAMVDFMVRDLRELQSDALEYWTLAADTPENKQRQIILAQKIKGMIKSLSADSNYYCARYCKCKSGELQNLLVEVADACTGGEFESVRKKIDTGRYILIVNAINRVKSELHRRKL